MFAVLRSYFKEHITLSEEEAALICALGEERIVRRKDSLLREG